MPNEQSLGLYLEPSQACTLEALGLDPVAGAIDAAAPKSAALGNSPNPFFNVYRSYSEPGGIADEMRATAAANPDVMKLENIGTSTLGKPILAIKMTATRATCRTARVPRCCSPPTTTRASGWPPKRAAACRSGSRSTRTTPKIKDLLANEELWFLPILNVDGYDFTFTCGTGTAQSAVLAQPARRLDRTNRFWRKTLRDNNNNGVYGDSQDGVDPNRNYPAKRGIDEEGAINTFNSETYRGPYPLSEPDNLAFDRLQRRVHFLGNINYHTDGQLLLTPVSYTTDYAPPDATIFDSMTGTDGDSAVFPYQPQRSSDLYESNGDTIDNAYINYGVVGWTPEMDTCSTGGDVTGCRQFDYPDNESKINAVFLKNLPFALNAAVSLTRLDRPVNYDTDPSAYQLKATEDIQLNRFDVSYGNDQQVEATVRKSLGDSDIRVTLTTPGNIATKRASTVVVPMHVAPGGRALRRDPGLLLRAPARHRAALFPASATPRRRPTAPRGDGDIVNVIVLAGGQQREFNYRVASLRDGCDQEARARRRRRGLHRRLAERHARLRHQAALPGAPT